MIARPPGGVARELDGPLVASVPELVRNTRFRDLPGASRAEPLAERGHALEVEVRAADVEESSAASLTAATTLGWPYPVDETAMPAMKSR